MRLHSLYRRLDARIRRRILAIGLIEVALNHPLVLFGGLAIHPETQDSGAGIQIPYGGVPVGKLVEVIVAGRAIRRSPVVELTPDPVGNTVIGRCTPSGFQASTVLVARGRSYLAPFGLLRLSGDHVDHS